MLPPSDLNAGTLATSPHARDKARLHLLDSTRSFC